MVVAIVPPLKPWTLRAQSLLRIRWKSQPASHDYEVASTHLTDNVITVQSSLRHPSASPSARDISFITNDINDH